MMDFQMRYSCRLIFLLDLHGPEAAVVGVFDTVGRVGVGSSEAQLEDDELSV